MAATPILASQYTGQSAAHYSYVPGQTPPSPPMDDASRCSLPSISNLLDLADASTPSSEQSLTMAPPQPQQLCQQLQPQRQYPQHKTQETHQDTQSPIIKPSTPPNAYYGYVNAPPSSHTATTTQISMIRNQTLPPTPPMAMEAGFDTYGSPTQKPMASLAAPSPAPTYFYDAASPPLDPTLDFQRPSMATTTPTQMHRISYQTSPFSTAAGSGAGTSQYLSHAIAAYYPTPTTSTAGSTYPPPPQPHVAALYYQRPLPQQFPPPPTMASWHSHSSQPQHHAYMPTVTAAPTFSQSQDRYVCPTCNKAFSRPSSLRIHSHSHTGEKPFKCPHPGCGKAFSVRSNMKRHERGCHSHENSRR